MWSTDIYLAMLIKATSSTSSFLTSCMTVPFTILIQHLAGSLPVKDSWILSFSSSRKSKPDVWFLQWF